MPSHNRPTTVTDSRGNKTLNYSYSPGGLLNRVQDSDGTALDYRYDPVGRLTGIRTPRGDITYVHDSAGRRTEQTLPNGANTRYSYNADDSLAQLINRSNGSVLSQHDYSYDTLGRRQTHTELIAGTSTPYQYVYNPLSQLTEVRNASTTALLEDYAYDPLGNRTRKGTTFYVYDNANQLTEAHSGTANGPLTAGFVYDANGNLSIKCETGSVTRSSSTCSGNTVSTLSVDALDRLTQITQTGLATESYGYDDSGRRTRKTVGGSTTHYLYNGIDIHAEYSNWTSPSATYTHGPGTDTPVVRWTGSSVQYYHQDGLGSVVALSNASGGTDATQRFDAWGTTLAATGTIPQYGYTGREPDATGFIYYRATKKSADIPR